ncbi:MAG: ion channel [Rhodothermales bacterium]|uniref:ion channel n=1 Tax=Roseibium sp. TaxID=1936156 RepID=UPI0032874370
MSVPIWYLVLLLVPFTFLGLPMWLTGGRIALTLSLVYTLVSSFVAIGFTWTYLSLIIKETSRLNSSGSRPSSFGDRVKAHFADLQSSGVGFLLVVVIAGYLLISIPFGLAYSLAGDLTTSDSVWDNVLFSTNLLSTVVFGDIKPVGFGKTLASIQTIVGLIFQVMVVALAIALVIPDKE